MCILVVFFVILCFLPRSLERSKSIGNFNDKAIANRVQLWKGTCGIIARKPFCGVPLSRVGLEYTSWYKPTELHEHYVSAINDILTFTASYGIVPAFVILSYIGVLLINLLRVHAIGKPSFVSAIALLAFLLVFSYLIIGIFNTYFMPHQGFLPFILLIFIGATACMIYAIRKGLISWQWKYCAYSSICSAILITGIMYEGWHVNRNSRYYVEFQSDAEGLKYPVIFPTDNIKGILFFIHRVPHERVHLYHGKTFILERWCDELNLRLRVAGNADFCSTAVFGDKDTDFSTKINDIISSLKKGNHNLQDKMVFFLADENCSYEMLKLINNYPQANNFILGLQDIVISNNAEDDTGRLIASILRNTNITTYIFTTYPIEEIDVLPSDSIAPCVHFIPYTVNPHRDTRIDVMCELVK